MAWSQSPRVHPALRAAGFALLYAAAVIVGRASRIDGTQTALVWPAAGVAVLWLLGSWRTPTWRGVDAALLFVVTVAGNLATGAPLALAGAFGAANMAQALVTAAILSQLSETSGAARGLRGLVRLTVAALIGTSVGAAVGPATLALLAPMPWPVDAPVWILRNGVSTFVLVAAGMAVQQAGHRPRLTHVPETALLLLAAAAINAAVFVSATGVLVAFAVVPASVIVGARVSVLGATIHNLLTWIIVATFTLAGHGPFSAEHQTDTRVLLAQGLVLIVAFLTLTLALSRHEERELSAQLQDEQAFVSALVDQVAADLVICDEHGRLQRFDPARRALAPRLPEIEPADWPELFGTYTPDGARLMTLDELPLYRALQGERVEPTEILMQSAGVDPRVYMVTASPVRDAEGHSRGAVARVVDVTEMRRAEAEARSHAADLAVIGRVAHQLASKTGFDDARHAICAAAREAAGAQVSLLFELHPDDQQLICTAADGMQLAGELSVPFTGPPSGTVIAFASGRPFFVADAPNHPAVNQRMISQTGSASALWQPVLRDGAAIAVLAVGWTEPVKELSGRTAEMLDLLAAEAALAIDRAALITQLDAIARTDPLTGAHNRRALTDRLDADMGKALRTGAPLCVVMADIDHFKRFNDTQGHLQGDRLLKGAVAAWSDELRPSDMIARYGGEEFSFVLPGCAAQDAGGLAERLRLAVPDEQTASFGIAEWDGSESADELLARADAALYRAKRSGRNRVEQAARPRGRAAVAPAEPSDESAEIGRMVLSTTRRLLGMDVAFLAEVDGDRLLFRQFEGETEAFGLAAGDAIPLVDSYCQRMLDGRTDGRVSDAAAEPSVADLAITDEAGIGAYIGAPITLASGRTVGTLCGLRRNPAQALSTDELALIRGLAQTIADHLQRLAGDAPTPAQLEAAWCETAGRLLTER